MSTPHPEFGPSQAARIADAALERLRTDAELAAWARGGIEAIELEELRITGTVTTPAIWLQIEAEAEERRASGVADLEVVLAVALITSTPQTRGTSGHLRSRVAERIRRRLYGDEGGLLRGPGGEMVTEALTRFERLPLGRLRAQPDVLLTTLRAVFEVRIDETTGEPIP